MNKQAERAVREACKRFMSSLKLEETETEAIRVVISDDLHFFVAKRKVDGRFSMLCPCESAGILAIDSTLARLQPILRTYGLLLSQEAVIMEENIKLSLDKRIGNMVWALIGLDGIRRLWKEEAKRVNAESKTAESTGNSPNDRSSR